MTATKENAANIIARAQEAATAASDEYLRKNGAHPFNCGFAWVTIKPARGAVVAEMKKAGIGRKGYHGGWQVWNPSNAMTQDMSAVYAGAKAYAQVLKDNGVKCYADSRLD